MTNIRRWGLIAAAIGSFGFVSLAQATPIDVLWYTYADPASEYRQKISQLSTMVHTIPQSGGSAWNLTYWDATSATPNLSAYDVLVIESGEAFRTGAPGGPLATPNYSGILNSRAAIEAARGERTFITGADSDFHAVRGDTGNIPDNPTAPDGGGKCSPAITSADCWDGALGHTVNAINWAGSGKGLGIVSFLDGEFDGSFWWGNADSFLRDELSGKVVYSGNEQNPIINPLQATHFLNTGLTSQGLSDWDNSFHAFFRPVDGYTAIVDSSAKPSFSVAIAKVAASNHEQVSQVSEPGIVTLMLVGLGVMSAISHRRTISRV